MYVERGHLRWKVEVEMADQTVAGMLCYAMMWSLLLLTYRNHLFVQFSSQCSAKEARG